MPMFSYWLKLSFFVVSNNQFLVTVKKKKKLTYKMNKIILNSVCRTKIN